MVPLSIFMFLAGIQLLLAAFLLLSLAALVAKKNSGADQKALRLIHSAEGLGGASLILSLGSFLWSIRTGVGLKAGIILGVAGIIILVSSALVKRHEVASQPSPLESDR